MFQRSFLILLIEGELVLLFHKFASQKIVMPTTPDIVGYAASIFVAISLSMSNMRKLRWLNLIGAGTFVLYALISPVKLYPVAIVNAYIACMNIYYLFLKKPNS
jgi:hypothetical protein